MSTLPQPQLQVRPDSLPLSPSDLYPAAASEPRADRPPIGRILASIVLLVFALAIGTYLIGVASGQIAQSSRLGANEVGLTLIGYLFLTLALYPEAFDRLSLLKLPGGVEIALREIQAKQQEQQTELEAFFAILSNLLSLPEKYHLRCLARGGAEYQGCDSLRNELFRLLRFGLISEVTGQKIGDMFDGARFRMEHFVQLTPTAWKFLRALDRIEAH